MLLEHRPPPTLAPCIEKLWYCEAYQAARRYERVLPNGTFQLVIDLASAFPPLIVGMRSRYAVLDTAALRSIMGVLFRPGGARAFFDAPADAFYNQEIPLDLVWGSDAMGLRVRLQEAATPAEKFRALEAALERRAKKRLELHSAVRYGLGEFRRMPHTRGVLRVTREAGLSRRRFSQLFREQVGLTPKLYCRLHRFQQVLRQIAGGGPVDWADVALAGGYCDQAHLAHEFRDFSGISPGAYLASDPPFPNHVPMD